jgi:predicted DsbA family dithiol-disulfide isomerase
VEGKDLSDRSVLAGIASGAGLDRDEVDRLMHGDDGLSGVQAEDMRAHRLGITGVPTFLVNGRIAFSGAQRPEEFLAAFRSASAGPSLEGEGAACRVDSGSGRLSC